MPRLLSLRSLCLALTLLIVGWSAKAAFFEEWKSGIEWPEPEHVAPGAAVGDPPADAIVLFDGSDMSQWNNGESWKLQDGYAIVGSTITTKEGFGDCQLHLEWAAPEEVRGSGQGRGNSGVYFMGRYEVQILDSYDNETYFDGQCASIYKQHPPLVNVCRPPGEWQSYDIIFTAPRFDDDGNVASPAYLTVLQNGVVVQNHFELLGGTFWDEPPHYTAHESRAPITIQDHGNPVKFRNIWVRDLMPTEG